MRLSNRRKRLWRYMVRQLKGNFSPGVPVAVSTRKLKVQGDSAGNMKLGRMVSVTIRIKAGSCWHCRQDTLMHEWAHAMEWSAHWTDDSPKREHGETWGVWYAKIYSHLVDKCWDDMRNRGLLTKEQSETDYDHTTHRVQID